MVESPIQFEAREPFCQWPANKFAIITFRSSSAWRCNSLFHIELLHPEWWLGRLLFYHFQRSVLCQAYSFSAPRCNTNGEKSGDKVLKATAGRLMIKRKSKTMKTKVGLDDNNKVREGGAELTTSSSKYFSEFQWNQWFVSELRAGGE